MIKCMKIGLLQQKDAPRGPQSGSWWETIFVKGTKHTEVIPFGPYLEDDVDITKLEYKIRFMGNRLHGLLNLLFMCLWVFIPLLLIILIPIRMAKFITR